MKNIKSVNVDEDNYNIIQITKETLEVPEEQAVNVLVEIGLFNILNYPTGNTSQKHRKIDKILSQGKYPKLVERLKNVWNL